MTAVIIIADDDVTSRTLVERVLVACGHRVLGVSNGEQVLEVMAVEPHVDLVICDVVMPVMGGRELLRRLRQPDSLLPVVPVLLISAVVEAGDIADDLLQPAAAFLAKPIDLVRLQASVRRLLQQSSAARPAVALVKAPGQGKTSRRLRVRKAV